MSRPAQGEWAFLNICFHLDFIIYPFVKHLFYSQLSQEGQAFKLQVYNGYFYGQSSNVVNLLVFLLVKPKWGCTKRGLCVVNVCLYIYKRGRWHRKESWGERKVAYQISQSSISRMLGRFDASCWKDGQFPAKSNICFYGAHYQSIRFLWLSKAITCPLRRVAAWCMVLFPIVPFSCFGIFSWSTRLHLSDPRAPPPPPRSLQSCVTSLLLRRLRGALNRSLRKSLACLKGIIIKQWSSHTALSG